jgi:hypothetical protein
MSLAPVPYIPVARSIFVDSTNGSAGGVRGELQKPFATIAQANAVAQAGDWVRVVAGTYNEKNIARTLVNYEIGPAATIDYTGVNGSLVDDTSDGVNGPLVTNVICHGRMINRGGGSSGRNNVVVCSNDNSRIYFYARYAEAFNGAGGGENSVVRQDGGFCVANVIEAVGETVVFWWSSGEGYIDCKSARERLGGTILYPFPGDAGGTLIGTWRSGSWYVNLDYGQCAGQAIRCDLGAPEARTWIFFKELAAPDVVNGFEGTILLGSGKNYLIGQKVSNSGAAAQNFACIAINGGENHIDVQKVANKNGPSIQIAAGENYVHVNRVEDTSPDQDLAAVYLAGGTGTVTIDDLIVSAQPGVRLAAGTVKLTANARAIPGFPSVIAEAQGTVLKDCSIKSAVGQNSLFASAAVNVNLEGVNEVDKDKHANVSLKGSGSLVKNVAGTPTVIYSPFV